MLIPECWKERKRPLNIEATESATERFDVVVDMVQVELMDGCVDVREMEGKEPSQILIESMQKRLVEMKNKCKWIEFL